MESSTFFSRASDFSLFRPVFNMINVFADDASTNPARSTAPSTRLTPDRVYVQELLFLRKGYPLWHPKPAENMPEAYRKEGVRIGDVGLLNESGEFYFLFNACLPADDPVNSGRVPEGFKPIYGLDDQYTTRHSEEYAVGSFVLSDPAAIQRLDHDGDNGVSATIGTPNATRLSFTSQASQGAVLILPEGGRKEDHQQLGVFLQYAVGCAQSWYKHLEERGLGNSKMTLYLVTGCDKTRAWGVASFTNVHSDSPVTLDFESGLNFGDRPLTYQFTRSDSATSASGTDEVFLAQSGCVFLRGFKIAIRKQWLSRSVTAIHLPNTNVANFKLDQPKMKTMFRRKRQMYHPSDTLNQWILDNNPKVDVAITHDDDWASVIKQKDRSFPGDEELVHRLSKNLKILKLPGQDNLYGSFETGNQLTVEFLEKGPEIHETVPFHSIRQSLVTGQENVEKK
ncbi:hypothetical protein GYMLUDRAFT_691122 [Collybiopsis luxurians FD-317 M1]|uniref:Uncharacterized protein n=1 Tax=Collybiopsis luxurians FD-317 M1 TaxID=944289 RepID=A0A0D0C8M1_9AGAR|nr:hypothetical protein GYMLUDRAFT_691122 [Collybiopsis luxurians FD-317 M1]